MSETLESASKAPTIDKPHHRKSISLGFFASLMLHVLVACSLIITVFPEERVQCPIRIESLPAAPYELAEVQHVEMPQESISYAAAIGGEGGGDALEISSLMVPGLSATETNIATSAAEAAESDSLSLKYALNAAVLNSVVTAGSGNEDGDAGYGVSFYGVRAKGRRMVFVADCSSSMSGGRLEALNDKLRDTIEKLDPRVEFAVIFFNHQPFVMPDLGMVAATPVNKKAYLEWTKTMTPSGGTEPSAAMEAALRHRPSVVFFLTDGTFPAEKTLDMIRRFRHSPNVPIYTIAIGRGADFGVLQRIAVATGGRFRQVLE